MKRNYAQECAALVDECQHLHEDRTHLLKDRLRLLQERERLLQRREELLRLIQRYHSEFERDTLQQAKRERNPDATF